MENSWPRIYPSPGIVGSALCHRGKIMRACYIAGPMRGILGYNYPAFMKADRLLTAAGWKTYNPAKMDIEEDGKKYASYTLEEQDLHDTAAEARRFAERDTRILIKCLKAENGDAIVVLPGWTSSVGAIAEVGIAKWVSLPVFTIEEVLDAPYRP